MKFKPYIYEPDKSIEVYKETEKFFEANPEIKEQIEELGWIYHIVGEIIPHNRNNFCSGHFFPFSDSWEELQVSFTQICFGLYKQAFVSLRSVLELGLLSVYYNINDVGHDAVAEWLESNADTPRNHEIWEKLRQNDNIKKFDTRHNLKQVHQNLGYLHDYVHSKGAKHSNGMGLFKNDFQTFEEELVSKWLVSFKSVVSLVCTLHLLKYPISVIRFDYRSKFGIDIPSFGGLDEFKIDKFASILPENYLKDILLIAKEDPTTQQIIEEISSLPDLTEDQVEEGKIEVEKMFIKNGEGFTRWLENQKNYLNIFGQSEFDEVMRTRIELLRVWATENNFLDSKAKRMESQVPTFQSNEKLCQQKFGPKLGPYHVC